MTNHSASLLTKMDGSPTATIAHGLASAAVKRLEERGLDLELLSRLGWRSSKAATDGDASIEIPYLINGGEVNVKTRTLLGEKKFFQTKDAVKCFYNMEALSEWKDGNSPLLICEGEIDCASAIQAGFLAVSVPDGAPAKKVNDGTVKYSFLDDFPPTGVVIICADADVAGENLLHDLGVRLGRHRCKWIKYPVGCKDLNDVLIKYGARGICETIARAEWLKVDGVYRMGELPPLPQQEALSCELFPINIRKGDFSVWSGIPSHGKSTLTNHLSFILAKKGWSIGVASFEQTPQTQHRYALRTLYCGVPAHNAHFQALVEADKWIDEKYSFIVPDVDSDEDCSLGWLLEKMAASIMRHHVDIFIIDPWNEMDHNFDHREMSQTDYTGFAVKQLKKFARRYMVHVAVVAHPTKMRRDKDGKYPVPTLYDIADSAHWANKPDLGVIVHREETHTMIRVQKSRYHHDIGKPDDYILDFDEATRMYSAATAIYSME